MNSPGIEVLRWAQRASHHQKSPGAVIALPADAASRPSPLTPPGEPLANAVDISGRTPAHRWRMTILQDVRPEPLQGR